MLDESRQTITIRLKPALHEFLRRNLQDDDQVASCCNFIGTLVRPFLSLRPEKTAPEFPSGPDAITIKLPLYPDLDVRHGTVYMSPDNQKHFEKILDAHFKEVFYNFVDDKVRYLRKEHTKKGAIKKSILQFCSDYRLSFDSTTYEMLQKSYYRRVKNITKKPPFFTHKLSAICPLLFLI